MTLYLIYWTLVSFAIVIFTAPTWPTLPNWGWVAPCIGLIALSLKVKTLRVCIGLAFACGVILIHGNLLRHQTDKLFKTGSDIIINAEVDSFFKQISHVFKLLISKEKNFSPKSPQNLPKILPQNSVILPLKVMF